MQQLTHSRPPRDVQDEVLPFSRNAGIGVIVYPPMVSGLLTRAMTREPIAHLRDDDWRKHDPRFTEPQLSGHLDLTDADLADIDNANRPAKTR